MRRADAGGSGTLAVEAGFGEGGMLRAIEPVREVRIVQCREHGPCFGRWRALVLVQPLKAQRLILGAIVVLIGSTVVFSRRLYAPARRRRRRARRPQRPSRCRRPNRTSGANFARLEAVRAQEAVEFLDALRTHQPTQCGTSTVSA